MTSTVMEETAPAVEEPPAVEASDIPPPIPGPSDPAPYGYLSDGVTPRAKPGRKPGQKNGTGRGSKAATKNSPPAPQPRKNGTGKPSGRSTQTDYRPGLLALSAELIGGVTTIGILRGDQVLIADAAAVSRAAPAIVESINNAADTWPVVAAICDKLLTFGPHAGGILAVVSLIGQIAVNHKMIPPGLVPGTMPTEQLAHTFVAERAAESPEFRAVLEYASKPAPAAS